MTLWAGWLLTYYCICKSGILKVSQVYSPKWRMLFVTDLSLKKKKACPCFDWMLQSSSQWKWRLEHSVETPAKFLSKLNLVTESLLYLHRSQLRTHWKYPLHACAYAMVCIHNQLCCSYWPCSQALPTCKRKGWRGLGMRLGTYIVNWNVHIRRINLQVHATIEDLSLLIVHRFTNKHHLSRRQYQ